MLTRRRSPLSYVHPFCLFTFYERATPVAQERNPTVTRAATLTPNAERRTPNAERRTTVREAFERVFERHGLPEAIRSDNGTPFASVQALHGLSRLSAWWMALGIDLERGRPAHPQDNGGHERLHRDIAQELEILGQGAPQRRWSCGERSLTGSAPTRRWECVVRRNSTGTRTGLTALQKSN